MGIKVTVQTSKTFDVGDPEKDEWVCTRGHVVSPNTMELDATWDFEDRIWYHQETGVRCGYPLHRYKKQ